MIRLYAVLLVFVCCVANAGAQTAPVVEYYHLDPVGSVRAVTDANGQPVRTHAYDPFGQGDGVAAGTDGTRFTGKERDPETGLEYFGARYYSQRTGRFTTVDPEVPLEDALLDPQRWNRYSYVMNRPLVLTDPDGRCPICYLSQLAQRLAASPLAQRAQQVIAAQGARAWNALTRLSNTPAGQDLVQMATEVSTGADLGPMSAGTAGVGAVIGHFNAGYAKVGRELRVAVFDIPVEMWNRMTPDQRLKANQAFMDRVVEQRLTVRVITNGFVELNSTLKWEIDYFLSKGYTWNKSGDGLLPPLK